MVKSLGRLRVATDHLNFYPYGYTMQKFNFFQATLNGAAVGGIFIIWSKFTIEAFNLAWHIVSTSPEEETHKAVFKISCENCRKLYDDDERHLINGSYLCEACRLKK